MSIENIEEFRKALESEFAFPGGYPVYFITSDGQPLSFKSAKKNQELIEDAIKRFDGTGGWRVIASHINYEDNELYCADTGDKIPSAYGDD